jgi:hypothetical protein
VKSHFLAVANKSAFEWLVLGSCRLQRRVQERPRVKIIRKGRAELSFNSR